MLSDLAILVEQAAESEEFDICHVKQFLTARVAARESTILTKADVSAARTHFGGERPKSGPRKRKANSVLDGSEPEGKRVRVNEANPPQISQVHAAPAAHHVGPSRVVW